MPTLAWLAAVVALACAAGCGDATGAPRTRVRSRIDALAPVADLGHRGTGPTRPGHALPENSLPSYREAIAEGADGVELDLELTADGRLVVMHDDTLDRTTTCSGCVHARTLAEVRSCRLLSGDGTPTSERPPTLEEVLAVLPAGALVNAELKVFGDECRTPDSGPAELAAAAVAEVGRLGAEDRVILSSFDAEAIAAVRAQGQIYAALLLNVRASLGWQASIDLARALDADAIHPFVAIPAEGVAAARAAGLQVGMWTVNRPEDMAGAIAAGATAIITDDPGLLRDVLAPDAGAAVASR